MQAGCRSKVVAVFVVGVAGVLRYSFSAPHAHVCCLTLRVAFSSWIEIEEVLCSSSLVLEEKAWCLGVLRCFAGVEPRPMVQLCAMARVNAASIGPRFRRFFF